MPSEYDFLSPYSRRLRRAGLAVIGVGAFLAGAVAMAAIVALPLFPLNGRDTTAATDRKTAATAQGPRREPEKAVAVTATTPFTSAQASDTGTTTSPEVPDTGARRATTGLAGTNAPASSDTSPGAKPEAAPLPASSHNGTSTIPQSQPQVPAAATGQKPKSEASVPRAGATTSSAAPANAEPPVHAADGSEASQSPKQKKPTASRTRRIQRERAAYRQRHEQRSTRAASSERRAGREYVDGNGVRYYVVPRSAESAFAYDDDVPRRRRVIIVRPGPFDDD